jgi:PAS domain S-box-containing protein
MTALCIGPATKRALRPYGPLRPLGVLQARRGHIGPWSPSGAHGQPGDLGGRAAQDRSIEFGRPGICHMPHTGPDLAHWSRLNDKPWGPADPWVVWASPSGTLGLPIYLRTPSAQGNRRGEGWVCRGQSLSQRRAATWMGTAELHHQKQMRLLSEGGITMRETIKSITKRLPSIYIDVPALRPGTVGAYALALAAVGVAAALRVAVDPYLVGAQFVTFFPAIVITTLVSGFGAGFFCAVLSTAAADFFVLEPRWSFNIEDPANVADLLLFGPLAAYCAILIGRMRLAIERQQAERAMLASKDNLQVALDAAQLGSWQYDLRHRVFSGDERAKEIFEFAENQAPLEEVMTWVNPDDVEKFLAAIEEPLDPVNPKRSVTEFRLRRARGETRWVETLGLAHFDGTGPERRAVSFRGTVQDITERKERQEREHLLMREINHRAKNMLSVVDAIAHQTATKTPEDFIERFSERIQALAANQDLLIRNEWRGVGAEDLVRAQLAPFAGLIGSRIVVRGPKLRLNAASAQAIGLALHELATNAGKYGSLSKDTGLVHIGWRTDAETFTMSWTERDGPPVSAPQRRGFGTIVTEQMTERSVGGAVDLDYAPSGLTWHLTCPAANALEPVAQSVPERSRS